MEYRRRNPKTGLTTVTHTPYTVTEGKQKKTKKILTAEMKAKNPLMYSLCNVGDEL